MFKRASTAVAFILLSTALVSTAIAEPILTVEAEAYSDMSGVAIVANAESSGEAEVSQVVAKDWMSYTLNLEHEGFYRIEYFVSSDQVGGKFELETNGKIIGSADFDLVNLTDHTGIVSMMVTLPAGEQTLTIRALTNGFKLDKFELVKVEASRTGIEAPSNIHIDAEDFVAMDGITIMSTNDDGSGSKIGYIHTQDWLTYAINIPVSGLYSIDYRVSSPKLGGAFQIALEDGRIIDHVNFQTTAGWEKFRTVEKKLVYFPEGEHTLKFTALSNDWNINHLDITPHVVNTPSVEPVPVITIEAEDYTAMLGINTGATTDDDEGLIVYWIGDRDWMDYSVNAPKAGFYKVSYRVKPQNTGGKFVLSSTDDNQIFDTVSFEATGDATAWQTIESIVYLSEAEHALRVKSIDGYWHFNKFSFEYIPFESFDYQLFNNIVLQAEDYIGMQGVQTGPSADVDGSLAVTEFSAQDWTKYAVNLPVTGLYNVTFRVASVSGAGSLQLASSVNNVSETVNFTTEPGLTHWTTVTVPVNLSSGLQELTMTGLSNDWSVNWVGLQPVENSSSSSSESSSSSVESSSSSSSSSDSTSSSSSSQTSSTSSSVSSVSSSEESSASSSSSTESSVSSSSSEASSSSSSEESSSVSSSSSIESSSSISSSSVESSSSTSSSEESSSESSSSVESSASSSSSEASSSSSVESSVSSSISSSSSVESSVSSSSSEVSSSSSVESSSSVSSSSVESSVSSSSSEASSSSESSSSVDSSSSSSSSEVSSSSEASSSVESSTSSSSSVASSSSSVESSVSSSISSSSSVESSVSSSSSEVSSSSSVGSSSSVSSSSVESSSSSSEDSSSSEASSSVESSVSSSSVSSSSSVESSSSNSSSEVSSSSVSSSSISSTSSSSVPSGNYTISTAAGLGGTFNSDSYSVAAGEIIQIDITLENGYKVESVTGCSGTWLGGVYLTGEITGNCLVEAVFIADPRPPFSLAVSGGDASFILSWQETTTPVDSYNVFYSTEPGITVENYSTLAGGTLLENVTSPHTISGLINGLSYHIIMTSVFENVESEASWQDVIATPSEAGGVLASRYEVLGGGVVRDLVTNLEWQRCSVGQVWNGDTCVGEAALYTGNGLEFLPAFPDGWRLPNRFEQRGLIYCSSGDPVHWKDGTTSGCSGEFAVPTLIAEAFPETAVDYPAENPGVYWTSSTNGVSSYATSFVLGADMFGDDTNALPIRLVRGEAAESQVLRVWSSLGGGIGSIESYPAKIICNDDSDDDACSGSFIENTEVILTATPVEGHRFVGWERGCEGQGATCTVTMDQSHLVRAIFERPADARYEFIEDGAVVRDLITGLEWERCSFGQTWDGTTCSGTAVFYRPNLTVEPGAGEWRIPLLDEMNTLVFCSSGLPAEWKNSNESCEGSFAQPTIDQAAFPNTESDYYWTKTPSDNGYYRMDYRDGEAEDRSANFQDYTRKVRTPVPTDLDLTLSTSGLGVGLITSSPAGIDCGTSCSATFVNGEEVTLTATPSVGSVFAGWSGACEGTLLTCTVSVSGGEPLNVQATFNTDLQALINTPQTLVATGSSIVLDGSSSVVTNGSIVSYLWTRLSDGVILGSESTLALDELPLGSYQIQLQVEDSAGQIVTSDVTIDVGHAPVIVAPDNVSGFIDTDIFVDGQGTHIAAGTLTYQWFLDGLLVSETPQYTVNLNTAGSYSLEFIVTSELGLAVTKTIPVELTAPVGGLTACPYNPPVDDYAYVAQYPATDIGWEGGNAETVEEIARAFNHARNQDPSVSQYLIMPTQGDWDAMSIPEKGLYLINAERVARGIKPYTGFDAAMNQVSQNYAEFIHSDNQVIGHSNDGLQPIQRMMADAYIDANADGFIAKTESVATVYTTTTSLDETFALVRGVYGWLYEDKEWYLAFGLTEGESWGHRDHLLQTSLQENHGIATTEGVVGIGQVVGVYDPFEATPTDFGSVTVFNTIDQAASWDSSRIIAVDVSEAQGCLPYTLGLDENDPALVGLERLSIEPTSLHLAQGQTAELTLMGYFAGGGQQDLTALAVFSADEYSVVDINQGQVNALESGQAKVHAQVGDIQSNRVIINIAAAFDSNTFNDTKGAWAVPYMANNATVASIIPDAEGNTNQQNYNPLAMSVFTGLVVDEFEVPLADVRVSFLNAQNYGSVLTDNEGRFILAGPAGKQAVVYEKANYLVVQRSSIAASNHWASMETVQLLPRDTKKTVINLNGQTQVHESSVITDEHGTRKATIVFNGITSAVIRSRDGSTRPITELALSATEFETPESMPGELPIETAFTWASDLHVDGTHFTDTVEYNNNVVMFVDNFLGFPVGEIVPKGYYSHVNSEWVASSNGVVVQLLDANADGVVDGLDYTGDSIADDLNGNGNTLDDAQGLGSYSAGETLWWGSFSHMTPYDYNWASGDAEAPGELPEETSEEKEEEDECEKCEGRPDSSVNPQTGSFSERLIIKGFDLSLMYFSQRTEGYDHQMHVQVSDDEIPASVEKMYARVKIGGKVLEQEFSPGSDVEAEFIWDGKHPDGTESQGIVNGKISVGYEYQTTYVSAGNAATDGEDLSSYPVAWATIGDIVTEVPGREAVIAWKESGVSFKNSHDNQVAEGWSLSSVHELDPAGKVYLGSGTVKNVASPSLILKTGQTVSAVTGDDGFYQSGGSNIDYTINDDNVLVDQVTGLKWQNTQTPFRTISKAEAQSYCAGLTDPSDDVWRLPTPKEVGYSISKSGNNVGQRIYSLTQARLMWHENVLNSSNSLLPAICVSGQPLDERTINGLQRNHTQEVVLDKDNGLMWQDSTDNLGLKLDWQASIDYCEASTHAGFDDWRLPNINELLYALPNEVFQFQTTLPDGVPWNENASQRNPYWSSTTNVQNPEQAWVSESNAFNSERFNKIDSYQVRCIREDGASSRMPYVFNEQGQHTSTTDITTGKLLSTNDYDSDGLLVGIVNRFGERARIERDSSGVPERIVAPNGEITTLDIDEKGDLKEVIYEDGTRHKFGYKEGHLLNSITDPNESEFIRKYDENGRIERIETPEGGFWDLYNDRIEPGVSRYGYTTAEGNNYETTHRRQANGDVEITTTTKTGGQFTKGRSEDGLSESFASYGMSATVGSVLDAKTLQPIPQTITVTTPSEKANTMVITKSYAENGADTAAYTINVLNNDKLSVLEVNGHTGERIYTSPENRIKKSFVDPETLLLDRVELPGLHTTSYDYDSKGRLEELVVGTRKTSYKYNDDEGWFGRLETVTAPDLKQTHYEYDLLGRVETIIHPDGFSTSFKYDANGNTKKVIVPTLAEHDFIYNGINQIDIQNRPEFESTDYDYNLDGQLDLITLTSGETIDYQYVQGRLDKIVRPEGVTDYRYQFGDQIDEIQIGTELVDYDYDGTLLTQLRYEGHLNTSIDYGYNNDFSVESLTYAGANTSVGYDDDGLMTDIHGYTVVYDPDNGLTDNVSTGQWKQAFGWTAYGEVETVNYSFNEQNNFSYSLTYNDAGQIETKTEQVDGGGADVFVYGYDTRQRLDTVTKNGVVVEDYDYDENGNRELRTSTALGIVNQAAEYNLGDQLENQGNTTYGYDANARLSEKLLVDGASSSLTTYVYDTQGSLKQVDTPTQSITYEHNALGNRVVKLIDGVVVEKYLWKDLTTLLATYNPDGTVKQRFEHTLGHTPTSFTQIGQRYFIQTDHLGTPRIITDSAGAIVKAITYDSFGNVISDSNPTFEIPFGFAGGLFDKNTGLIRFGFRDYDPEIGRWVARDPIGFEGGDSNLYGYVSSNPVNFTDPTGLVEVYAFPMKTGGRDYENFYEFEFEPPNLAEGLMKKKIPRPFKKFNKFLDALGWALYPDPAEPNPDNYACAVLDGKLMEEFEKKFGDPDSTLNRLSKEEAIKWLGKMWKKYPEMAKYYPSVDGIISAADLGAKNHEYNEILQ